MYTYNSAYQDHFRNTDSENSSTERKIDEKAQW